MNGTELIRKLQEVDKKVIVLVIIGYSDIRNAIEVVKLSAIDYIPKPLISEDVSNILKQLTANNVVIRRENPFQEDIVILNHSVPNQYFIGRPATTNHLYQQV